MRTAVALVASRAASWLSRTLAGGSGGVIGGRVMLALADDVTARFSEGRSVILVSGTNGKTTTTAMLAAAIRVEGDTASNFDGANTPPGLVTTLARDGANSVVLETDEAWLSWAIEQTRPHAVVLLNLSRDQLHRNPEPRSVAAKWRAAMATVPVAVANADDPAVVWAAETAKRVVWVSAGQVWPEDSLLCPACGRLLHRVDGVWMCDCGRRRPTPDWSMSGNELRGPTGTVPLSLTLPGSANAANAAMAIAAAAESGIPAREAAAAAAGVREVAGRYARVPYGDHAARLVLAKNPAGWIAAMRMVAGSDAPVVIAFNSDGVDGRDPSWLYDVDFTPLRDRQVVVCGRRRSDMTVRLRIDGLDPDGQYPDLESALRAPPSGPVDVIANYTAFQEARRILRAAA